jgi:hypothetical protein
MNVFEDSDTSQARAQIVRQCDVGSQRRWCAVMAMESRMSTGEKGLKGGEDKTCSPSPNPVFAKATIFVALELGRSYEHVFYSFIVPAASKMHSNRCKLHRGLTSEMVWSLAHSNGETVVSLPQAAQSSMAVYNRCTTRYAEVYKNRMQRQAHSLTTVPVIRGCQ